MAGAPRLSVVVPTYNRRHLLSATLASLSAQDNRDCEFLILDDASEDGTARLVRDACAGDRRFRLLRNERNLGFQRNLHRGLTAARSDNLLLLGDDDVLLPGTVDRFEEIFDRYPDVTVVLCNMVQLDASGTRITYVHRRFSADEVLEGRGALVALWPEATFISGLGLRRGPELTAWRAELVYPQLDLVARLLKRGRGLGTVHYGVGARVHDGQLGNAVLDGQEREALPHVFAELPRILRDVYPEEDGALVRAACEPYLRRNYRVLILNRRIERGARAAWKSLVLGLRTHPPFRHDPLFLATVLPPVAAPAAVARGLKETVRRRHLARHPGPSLRRQLSPALSAFAGNGARPCEACGGALTETRIDEIRDYRYGFPGRFRLLRCPSCGVGFTDPVPTDVGDYYPPDYAAHQTVATSRSRQLAFRARAGRGAERPRPWTGRLLAPLLTLVPRDHGEGRLLDVGCGSGRTIAGLRSVGWDVTGVEIDEEAVRRAREAGLHVLQGSFDEVTFSPGSFDVVRMSHVLEHTERPRAWLERAFALLRPGGLLLVGVPNVDGITTRVFGRHAIQWDVPRHLSHFTLSTLIRLVRATGFEVAQAGFNSIHSDYPLRSLESWLRDRHGIRSPVTSRVNIYLSPFPLLSILLDALGIGDNIEVTARRPV